MRFLLPRYASASLGEEPRLVEILWAALPGAAEAKREEKESEKLASES